MVRWNDMFDVFFEKELSETIEGKLVSHLIYFKYFRAFKARM